MTKTIAIIIVFFSVPCVLAPGEQPTQDFPVAELKYKDKTEFFYLYSDFGFIAKWEEDNKPKFFIYDKIRKRISVTRDLSTFLNRLLSFPEEAEVAWINTCSAPLHYRMPSEMLTKIHDILKRKKFKMAGDDENNFVLCTCETTKVLFLENIPSKLKNADK